MADQALRPPPEERALGLEFYATRTPGVAAKIKTDPGDFEVEEISRYPLPEAEGPFSVLRIRSTDWEQHELGRALARSLGVRPSAMAWAGTKDRRAVAERLASYRGALPDRELGLPRVELLEAYRARDGLSLGHHYGNSFRIRLVGTSIDAERAGTTLAATREALRETLGIPNLFGPQRFGEVRPVTHLVGRELVRGDAASAVEIYLADRVPGGEGPGDEARRSYAEHHDPARALREFPEPYRFERTLLERLARGRSPEQALMALPADLRRLFVHAYQSYLFNRIVSGRVASGVALTAPQLGDRVVRLGTDGTPARLPPIIATSDNEREVRETVVRGRGVVAGPLVGYGTPPIEGRTGETLDALLEADGVHRESFGLTSMPSEGSEGTWRPFVVPPPPIGISPAGEGDLVVRFALPKGSYATVLTREFLKSGAA
ncbi:MAG TPA: tRNA pseudouridine(13) synthase TruD [Thermoplasmata archaeon]|nr:tRNA pseudouridine(13) synthase TruD [Thermoplasmata archaeon]